MSVTVDRLLIVQLTNWINDNAQNIPLEIPLFIDTHESTGEQIWIQALAGTTKTQEYFDKSYTGQLPFAVYYQLTNPDNMANLDVPLWNLSLFFDRESPEVPIAEISSIEMTSNPNAFYRGEDGTCINQAIYLVTYFKDKEE